MAAGGTASRAAAATVVLRCRRGRAAGWGAHGRADLRVRAAMLALAVLVGGCAGQRGALQPPHSPFTRLDVDADGWLVPAELEALPALRAGFERWDSDGDGRIAWPEFQRWRGHALQAGPQGG